jgi:hypothetical protein
MDVKSSKNIKMPSGMAGTNLMANIKEESSEKGQIRKTYSLIKKQGKI